MNFLPFDRKKHIYKNAAFVELVKDAIRFFNGTPAQPLPPLDGFLGAGIYALYYTGRSTLYKRYAELNRLAYNHPIYVGKAVPKGWRQARLSSSDLPQSRELIARLREHSRSIDMAQNLKLEDFACRFVIFEGESADMISSIWDVLHQGRAWADKCQGVATTQASLIAAVRLHMQSLGTL